MILQADVTVIGAGPAGCSAAIFLAKQGFQVILADKATFPRPKACGEGVMPSGLAILGELGVLSEVEAAGRPYRGIQFTSARGKQAAGHFPDGRHGIAIRRDILDFILLRKAKSLPNIRVLEGVCITEPLVECGKLAGWTDAGKSMSLRADCTFVADGAASSAARSLRIKRALPSRVRFGIRTHFRQVAGLKDLVEVFFRPDGEIYLAPQGQDGALVSVLLEATALRKFAGRTTDAFMEMAASCPELGPRLAQASRTSALIGFGPLGGQAEQWHGPGWLLVGDSAGSVDPITGEGISLALMNGKLAAGQFESGNLVRGYDRKRRRLVRGKNLLSNVLLQASGRPMVSDLLVSWLGRRPAVFEYFLSTC